jgi:hypothetical protein
MLRDKQSERIYQKGWRTGFWLGVAAVIIGNIIYDLIKYL